MGSLTATAGQEDGRVAMEPLGADDPAEIGGYQLHAKLGAGGMGRVYLAFTGGGRPVALKVVRPELGDDPDFRARFRHEVAAARRVHGLYTAQVLDADPDAAPPWLVTMYVPGLSLHQAVAVHGPMPVGTVLVLMAGVAEALQAIHAAGVVHRDLKPSNVLLAADGPRVIDFGIARALEASTVTRTGVRVGSPQFMAPEQAAGQEVTPAIDVFALGALAMFAATGRAPFGEGSQDALLYRIRHEPADLSGCPEPLRTLAGRCLAKDPADRPAPAEVVAECQRHLAAEQAEPAGAVGVAGAALPWLPPDIAAVLAGQAAQAGPAEQAAQAGPVRPAGTELPATESAAPGPASPRPATELAGDEPTPQLAAQTGSTRPGPAGPGSWLGWPRRRAILAGLAAVAVLATAGVGATLAFTGQPGASSGHPRPTGSARLQHTLQATAPASPKPTLPSTIDSCVVGTWIATAADTQIKDGSVLVPMVSHHGPVEIDRPDGTMIEKYGSGTVFTGSYQGTSWRETFRGHATMHYEDRNGVVYLSDIAPDGQWTLLRNGAYSNSGPLTIEAAPYHYSCGRRTMREFFSNGSTESRREGVASRPTGS
jgi:hypothetical protein